MKQFDEFTRIMTDAIGPVIKKFTAKEKLNNREEFLLKIFEGFRDILETHSWLKDLEIIIGLYPYKNKISKVKLLKYHFLNYLHEMYILQKRLESFLKILEKSYKKDKQHDEFKKINKKLKDNIVTSLKNITSTRNNHVHKTRFINKEFNELEMFETVLSSSSLERDEKILFERSSLERYKEHRKKFKEQILENNKELEKILDFYFGNLIKMIVQGNQIMSPSNYD